MTNHMQAKSTPRNQTADALRGAAAVLVIVGHLFARDASLMQTENRFYYLISCIHVGIFFFFAGYFAKSGLKKGLARFVGQKAIRLLVPYVMWSSAAIAAKALLAFLQGAWNAQKTIHELLHSLIYGDSAWFFLSLFLMHLFFWCIYNGYWAYKWTGVLILAALYLLPMPEEFMLHKTQTMMPFFAIGMLAAYKKEWLQSFFNKHRLMIRIFALAICLAAPLFMDIAFAYGMSYGILLILSNLLSMLAACAVCLLIHWLFDKVPVLNKAFVWIGVYSMEVYCIHMIFVSYLPITLPTAVLNMPEIVPNVIYLLLACLMALIIAALSQFILNRIPIYRWFMLGQWPKSFKNKKGENYDGNLEK